MYIRKIGGSIPLLLTIMKYYDKQFKEELHFKRGTPCIWMSEDGYIFKGGTFSMGTMEYLIYDRKNKIMYITTYYDEAPGFPIKLKIASDTEAETIRNCFINGQI
jgi:hypothetical protein